MLRSNTHQDHNQTVAISETKFRAPNDLCWWGHLGKRDLELFYFSLKSCIGEWKYLRNLFMLLCLGFFICATIWIITYISDSHWSKFLTSFNPVLCNVWPVLYRPQRDSFFTLTLLKIRFRRNQTRLVFLTEPL